VYCNVNEMENEVSKYTKLGLLLMFIIWQLVWASSIYEGWNFNSGNYLFTTDTK